MVNRAIDILEFINRDIEKEYSLSEIANSLKLNRSTCANNIKTLADREYIEQKDRRRGYKLGSQAYSLSENYSNKDDLLLVAVEPMRRLRLMLNETCLLAILRNNKRITIHIDQCTHDLKVVFGYQERNAYLTASGRLLISTLTDDEQDSFINQYGIPEPDMWPEIKNVEGLRKELAKIKEKEIAVHFDKSLIVGIAVPVFMNDKVIASLAIYLHQSRFTFKSKNLIFDKLKKTGYYIRKELESFDRKNYQ